MPSEPFTALEQICHIRDIEIEGYQVRIRRTLEEREPFLPSIDSETIARQRQYGAADPAEVFAQFRFQLGPLRTLPGHQITYQPLPAALVHTCHYRAFLDYFMPPQRRFYLA